MALTPALVRPSLLVRENMAVAAETEDRRLRWMNPSDFLRVLWFFS